MKEYFLDVTVKPNQVIAVFLAEVLYPFVLFGGSFFSVVGVEATEDVLSFGLVLKPVVAFAFFDLSLSLWIARLCS